MSLNTNNLNIKKLTFRVILMIFNLLIISLLLRLGAYLELFSKSKSTLDIDRVIISNKVELSKNEKNTDIIFIGDSSCLMNINADKFTDISAIESLNLGTLSYLDFESYGALLTNAINTIDSKVTLICLIIHPEFLRRAEPSESHIKFFKSCNKNDYTLNFNEGNYLNNVLSLNIFKDAFYGKTPIPLEGRFGKYYGFTSSLNDYLNTHRGSAIDPREFSPKSHHGNILYRITDRKIEQLIKFKALLPSQCKLVLCLSPIPDILTDENYIDAIATIKNKIKKKAGIDYVLSMPVSLPSKYFSTKTHLNSTARLFYTEALSREITDLNIFKK